MHWWNGDGHMGWMGIWWIVGAAVILWALLRSSRGSVSGSRQSPEQLLKRRYAKGEIDHETYQRMLRELKA